MNRRMQMELCFIFVVCLFLGCCPNRCDPGMENVIHNIQFSSSYLGAVKYTLYLPKNYERDTDKRYPVLYLLHGGSGNHRIYVCLIKLTSTIETLSSQDKFGPMIIVMPDGDTGWWVNRRDGTKPYESFLINELIPYIDAQYRTMADKEHRAIGGLSMGGFGAFSLAFRHVDLFKAVAATSAAIPPTLDNAATYPIFLGTFHNGLAFDKDYYLQHDPLTLAESAPNIDQLGIFFHVGELDPESKVGCDSLDLKLTRRGISHQYAKHPGGGHDYFYFNAHIAEFLEFIWVQIHP